ncbi:unnamed protein product [Chrysoparadoxa australica]
MEDVGQLSHSKLLKAVREMNEAAEHKYEGDCTRILEEISMAKKQHRARVKRALAEQKRKNKTLYGEALRSTPGLIEHEHEWNDSTLLDPARERLDIAYQSAETSDRNEPRQKFIHTQQQNQFESWRYGEGGLLFGQTPLSCLTHSFRAMLVRHLEETCGRIRTDADMMPEMTAKQCGLKADVAAELWLLENELEEARKGMTQNGGRKTKGATSHGMSGSSQG